MDCGGAKEKAVRETANGWPEHTDRNHLAETATRPGMGGEPTKR